MKKLFYLAFIALSLPVFTACDNDDEPEQKYNAPFSMYFLNEGSWGKNNASITGIEKNDFDILDTSDIYMTYNGQNLGDVAQDLIYDEKTHNLYVSVSESKYIAKLSATGKELARYSSTETQAQPRSLVLEDGKLYASFYGGMVARFDTVALTLEATVNVGTYSEEMAVIDGKMAVCNSGYGAENTISIIDLKTFTVSNTIELPHYNPQDIVACNGKFYCNTTEYDEFWNADNTIVEINPSNWNTKDIAKAFYMAPSDNKLYLAKSETDWSTYSTVNTFSVYDTATGKTSDTFLNEENRTFLKDKSIYGISVDPSNGDVYIPVTNTEGYEALNSDVYVFGAVGSTPIKYTAGVYCSKVVFAE